MTTISLRGKTALVTGGASKIGTAIVAALSEADARIAMTYRTHKDEAEALAKSVNGLLIKADTTKAPDCARAVKTTIEKLGAIDILVNNAGIWMGGAFDEIAEQDMDALIETNLKGTLHMCRSVIPHMKRRKQGIIINLATSGRNIIAKGNVSYGTSKSGVIGFTKALARELGPFGIRVNAVSPGWIPSEAMYNKMMSKRKKGTPEIAIPFGKPEYAAGAVLFFASDLSRYVTGEVLNVHGSGS